MISRTVAATFFAMTSQDPLAELYNNGMAVKKKGFSGQKVNGTFEIWAPGPGCPKAE